MLDFSTVKKQIAYMVGEQKSHQNIYQKKVEKALEELKRWQDWSLLNFKLSQSKTSWLTAQDFSESLTAFSPLPPKPKRFTVIATDGSQIFPDRHEIALCYLINISSIVLHYGTGERPLLTSRPTLFYKEEDLYKEWNRHKVPVDGEMVGILRNLMEFQELARLAAETREQCEIREQGDMGTVEPGNRGIGKYGINHDTEIPERSDLRVVEDSPHPHVPTSPRPRVPVSPQVALYDGTLIFWHLEATPEDFSAYILREFLKVLDSFQRWQVPIAGYISYPRSADVIHTLRVGMCPERFVNCDKCPYRDLPELPCEPIQGVIDQTIFSYLLEPGERSTVFKSTSKILKNYGPHSIYFFYLNVGSEIARVEIPEWVARNQNLLALTHAVIYDQVEKGQGYPVSLTEAHEKAVVRGPDRELFYRILQDALVQQNIRIQSSRKSQKKRQISI